VLVISSGAIYNPKQDLPLSEDSKTLATSPYVISKLLTEDLCEYYSLLGLDIIVARPFNHIGPGQRTGFLVPDLVEQVGLAIKDRTSVKVGNLKTKRDYTDVRDVVKAYEILATSNHLNHNLYNICSGKSTSGEEILQNIIKELEETTNLVIEIDESKIRKNDAKDIYGDYSRLKTDTGWEPTIPLSKTIKDIVSSQ
jgi:GDP-4-dehydro-6-deoxy-D-mannose reductase